MGPAGPTGRPGITTATPSIPSRCGRGTTRCTSCRFASMSCTGTACSNRIRDTELKRDCCGLIVAIAIGCGRIGRPPEQTGPAGTGAVTTVVPTESDARVPRVEELLRGVPGLDVTRLHARDARSEEHTSELQSQSNLVCRL